MRLPDSIITLIGRNVAIFSQMIFTAEVMITDRKAPAKPHSQPQKIRDSRMVVGLNFNRSPITLGEMKLPMTWLIASMQMNSQNAGQIVGN